MIYLIVVCLLGLWYIAWRVQRVEKLVATLVVDKQMEEEVSKRPEAPLSFLPDEWTDCPWSWKSRQEERRPLVNPNMLQSPDDFTYMEMVVRLTSLSEPLNRIAFLSALRSRQTYFNEKMTAAVLRDESPLVRAWGAANLDTEFRDYKDHEFGKGEAPLIVDFEEELLNDGDPLVKASLWKHAGYKKLPWGRFGRGLNERWIDQFKALSQLERMALMHNIGLSTWFVVALLNVETTELAIPREEHARLLFTASQNPHIVVDSRHFGREVWAFEDDANPPFEEYGQMWEACVARWMDQTHVVYSFLKYTQATPDVKLKVYQKLLETEKTDYLRQAIIEGCDAFTDKNVLKVAWNDPDKDCKKSAEEAVGHLKDFVDVK